MAHVAALLLLLAPLEASARHPACELPDQRVVERLGARDSTIRVLFLGNSHTYVNQVPCLVRLLAASLEPGLNLEVVTVARDGATLEQHWADSATRDLVRTGGWDVLVLQERGRRPIEEPDRTAAAARQIGLEARRTGARVVLYVAPVGRGRSADLPRIDAAYRRIAADAGAAIAPVAQAWAAAAEADPGLGLHDVDGIHATPVGSYLTACVLLAAITGRSPRGSAPLLLRRPSGSAPAARAALGSLEPARAAALQAAAWNAVQAW